MEAEKCPTCGGESIDVGVAEVYFAGCASLYICTVCEDVHVGKYNDLAKYLLWLYKEKKEMLAA